MAPMRPICVLSVGRSGSSLAARALGLLGLELGDPDDMYPADEHNERGYWELQAVNSLNDEILAALGGSLWDPPTLPAGWERNPSMDDLRRRIRALVDSYRERGRRWAFKDTRTVYTLPLWRDALGEADYLLCVRSPREVITSLSRLLPEADSEHLLGLWMRANCIALGETAGRRRLILRYEDWFEDPRGAATRLCEFVGLEASESRIARVESEFEPSLRRAGGDAPATASLALPFEARVLEAALARLAHRDDADLEALATETYASYARRVAKDRSLGDDLTARERDLDQTRAELARLERRVAEASAHAHDLQRRIGGQAARVLEHDAARQAAETRLEVVTGSATWRLTAPLRAARHGDPRRALAELRALLVRR